MRKGSEKVEANTVNVNCSTCNKQKVLEHQLEEWKTLNEYINQIDLNYQQAFVIMVSVFALIAGVITSNIVPKEMMKLIFIVPLGLVAVFSYLSYQFRITAILRGHLAALEDKMNKTLDENVHMWNSALIEAYMANNNTINRYMMVPIMIFIVLLVIYCISFTWITMKDVNYGVLYFGAYWMLVAVGIVIVLPPFLKNEEVRKETYDEEKVMKMYRDYIENREEGVNKSKRQISLMKRSVVLSIANFALGFGVMCVFWYFADKETGLKGLFDYYAAVIGDALFLTILLGAGSYFIVANGQNISQKAKRIVWKISILATIIGVLTQILWLLNPDTGLNWTLDRPHHFTAVGWYHAMYFVTMFGVVTYISTKAIYINHKLKVETKISYVFVWLSGMGYWYMHLIDDCLEVESYMTQIIWSFIVFAIMFFLCEVFKGTDFKKNVKSYTVYLMGSVLMTILLIVFCNESGLEWNVQVLFGKIIQAMEVFK